ncbi:hypothetical protein TSMEX_009132 [Taenia solium]|eukprot:TsM_000880900 transcript=TsM_000880900 gene=TsM_000880900
MLWASSVRNVSHSVVGACIHYKVSSGLSLSSSTHRPHHLLSETLESEANAVSEHEDNEGTQTTDMRQQTIASTLNPCQERLIVAEAVVLLLLITSFYTRETRSSRTTEVHLTIHDYIVGPEEGVISNELLGLDPSPWPNDKRPNISSNLMAPRLASFNMKMSPSQCTTLEKLIDKFERVMISLKLQDQWFLGAGSLVGSLQHHDLTPWDDIADVVVHLRHRPRIQEALNNPQPEFGTYAQDCRDRFFLKPLATNAKSDLNTIGSHSFSHLP